MCTSFILGLRLLEYIYVLLSSVPFIFDIPDITTSIMSPTTGPSVDPGVGLGGTTAPFLFHRLKRGRIPSSTPFAEDFHSLCFLAFWLYIFLGVCSMHARFLRVV